MKRAITTRMEVVESSIEDLFKNLYCKRDFKCLLDVAKKAQPDRRPFVIKKVVRMLLEMGVECEYGKSVGYYEKIVQGLDIPANTRALEKRFIEVLYKFYSVYPTPEEFMQRIVDSLAPEGALSESLQLRILKRFVKNVNVKENKKYYSKTFAKTDVSELDESIFDILACDQKDDRTAMVQAAYNLAKGKFISPVTTKELLFLFAFAFDMRYYPNESAKDYDVSRDVERNLFADYYSDNLTRYIYSEDGGKSGGSDKEPSGVGINPKNFIDVIFVYYLNNKELQTEEKVSKFYGEINFVKDSWKSRNELDEAGKAEHESKLTSVLQDKIDGEISNMSEDELREYLLSEYYCDVRYTYLNKKSGELREGSCGPFELQFALNSAYEEYEKVLDLIKNALGLPRETDFSKIDLRTVKDVADGRAFDDLYTNEDSMVIMRVSELEGNVPGANMAHIESLAGEGKDMSGFISIMRNIEKRLDPYEALGITDPSGVTRTKLIAAYYHYHCLERGLTDTRDTWEVFKDVWVDMSSCVNKYLRAAGYREISAKNLFDVFIIFFAYCKINSFFE